MSSDLRAGLFSSEGSFGRMFIRSPLEQDRKQSYHKPMGLWTHKFYMGQWRLRSRAVSIVLTTIHASSCIQGGVVSYGHELKTMVLYLYMEGALKGALHGRDETKVPAGNLLRSKLLTSLCH